MTPPAYSTEIFAKPERVPDPPAEPRLRASGLSVVVYALWRRPFDAPSLDIEEVAGSGSYAEKLHDDSGVHYSELRSHAEALHSAVWIDDEIVLVTMPLKVETQEPLGLEQLLAILEERTRPARLRELAAHAVAALPGDAIRRDLQPTPLGGRVALQLWDLTGSGGRRDEDLFDGVRECRQYAWELSALMSHTADHLVKGDQWRTRGKQAVFNDLRHGFSIMGDHMAFVNPSCCLEITHTRAAPHKVFDLRLERYGYDSSAIFVWTLSTLRSATARELRDRYRGEVEGFLACREMSADEHSAFVRRYVRHRALIDRIGDIGPSLVEPRNRALDEELARLNEDRSAFSGLEREMERASVLAADLARSHDQALQSRENRLLALLAVAVGVIGIPELVGQVGDWITKDQWWQLAVAAALMAALIVSLYSTLGSARPRRLSRRRR